MSRTLHRLGAEHHADIAELLTSELVTNAILHAGSDITVRVWSANGRSRVEVVDASPALPAQRFYGPEASTGRGLELVEALAAAWGTEPDGSSGKIVWFELEGNGDRTFA